MLHLAPRRWRSAVKAPSDAAMLTASYPGHASRISGSTKAQFAGIENRKQASNARPVCARPPSISENIAGGECVEDESNGLVFISLLHNATEYGSERQRSCGIETNPEGKGRKSHAEG